MDQRPNRYADTKAYGEYARYKRYVSAPFLPHRKPPFTRYVLFSFELRFCKLMEISKAIPIMLNRAKVSVAVLPQSR